MRDASRSTATPIGLHGAATTAGTTARGLPSRQPNLSLEAEQLLADRGLEAYALSQFQMVSAIVDGCDDWLAIPTLRKGRDVRWKYRRVFKSDAGPNFLQDRGGEQCVWNPDALSDEALRDQPLLICEGELDAMSAIQCGFQRTVSLPNGSTIPSGMEASAWIDEILRETPATSQIVIATDGDDAGDKARHELAIRLGAGRCRYVEYPVGCKDLNDALRRFGKRGVVESINRARWCKVSGVFRMSELPHVPQPEPYLIGLPGLNDHYRVRLGDLCVMTGIPGHGKSTVANDIACRLVDRHGFAVGFASFEQSPALDHKRALRTWFNQKPAAQQTREQLEAADEWIDANFGFIVPDDDEEASLEWVMERAASMVVRYGMKAFYLDPWNEVDHERPRDMTMTEYVNAAIRRFKRFARKFNVHLTIVAHPTKLARNGEGKLPMPTLYDISDSAAWANKADVGIIVHRDERTSIIRVAKSRYHEEIGQPGQIEVTFSPYNNRFC